MSTLICPGCTLPLRRWAVLLAVWLTAVVSGCSVVVHNHPSNLPLLDGAMATAPARDIVGERLLALSFSGGGLRAAAFSHGVLQAIEALDPSGRTLDDITLISSVSGGSLTAAYFGLHGRAGMAGFRERVLLQDMEKSMRTSALDLENLARVLAGGLNDRGNLVNWLDRHLFEKATFADLWARRKPDIWINASDLYHRTPFPFIPPIFQALCSDLSRYSVAEAVAASMAVPLVFSPIVLQTFPQACTGPVDLWVERALTDPAASKGVFASAQAMQGYRDPARVRYVKLVDGGVTDNFGLASLLLSRAVSRTPFGPLTARDAVRLQRLLFLVVDAGRGPGGDWTLSLEGPSGLDAAMAATDSAIDSAARVGYDGFRRMMQEWRASTIAFRCSLPADEVLRLRGSTEGWRCDDLHFELSLVSLADLGPEREAVLNAIPTRLSLPADTIDAAIRAGFEAARANPSLRAFVHPHQDGPLAGEVPMGVTR